MTILLAPGRSHAEQREQCRSAAAKETLGDVSVSYECHGFCGSAAAKETVADDFLPELTLLVSI